VIAVATRLLLRRALLAVPLVFAVVALTFFFIRLAPGDPAQILAGDAPTAEFLAQVRSEYGLDRPVLTQSSHSWARPLPATSAPRSIPGSRSSPSSSSAFPRPS
jgi:ABC-type dipeptide/oligopeptide/nickel transport system permease component